MSKAFSLPPNHVAEFAAIACALSCSSNLLTWMGVPYVAEGGILLFKLHPANLLCFGAFFLYCWRRGCPSLVPCQSWKTDRLLAVYLVSLSFCLVSELLLTGVGNVVVLLDTFFPAGCLALALSRLTETERQSLLSLLRLALLSHVAIAIAECLFHATLIPVLPGAASDVLTKGDFRPFGLFDHPLTGATATLIGLLLPVDEGWGRVRRAGYFLVMGLGLLAFGERSMIAVALAIAVAISAYAAFESVLHRRSVTKAVFVCASVVMIALLAVFVCQLLGLGERLGGHLYWDGSARVRLRQWDVLGLIDYQQLIFGMPRQEALGLLEPMRMKFGVPVLENSWLLLFMSLGFAFPIFVIGIAALSTWIARRGGWRGTALAISLLATASSSNALGRKSIILIVFVAAAASLPARLRFAGPSMRQVLIFARPSPSRQAVFE